MRPVAFNVLTDYAEASMHGQQKKVDNWMDGFVSVMRSSEFSFDRYLIEYRETIEIIESL